jgi:signal transduction histidine kinase
MVPVSLRTRSPGDAAPRRPLPGWSVPALLVLGVAAVFAVVVAGGRALLGERVPVPGLVLVAAAVTALAHEPLRRRLTRWRGGAPEDDAEAVVDQLAAALAGSRDPDQALADVAGAVLGATAADRVSVWLAADEGWVRRVDAALGAAAATHERPVHGPADVPGDLVVPLVAAARPVGALAVTVDGGTLLPREERLVRELATGAGPVAGSALLRDDLRRRLAESRDRRARLVEARARLATAQEAQRRRLAADIHDGCQQRAAVVAGKLGLARSLAASGAPRGELASLADEVRSDLDRLSESLVAVTDGAEGTELRRSGPVAALTVATAGLGARVEVEGPREGRGHPAVEEALYYVCLEAVQNAVRHAGATTVRVRLAPEAGAWQFRVTDDGAGFDPARVARGAGLDGMRRRVEELGGVVDVRSSAAGTAVEGRVPDRCGVVR